MHHPKHGGYSRSSVSRTISEESDRYTVPKRRQYPRPSRSRPTSDISEDDYLPPEQDGYTQASRPLSYASEESPPPARRDFLHPSSARPLSSSSQLSDPSIYSQMTGLPPKTPSERHNPLRSKFSMDTLSTVQHQAKSKQPFWK
ncbi:hypothetical protein NMY22_g18889 [Coprinellus aureogranulatus]|nr:hypothetical protein NMY22_g18889 [Coprinellus aureogranulatus]